MRSSLITAPLIAASVFFLSGCEKPVDPKPALRAVAFLLFSADDVPSDPYTITFSSESNAIILTLKNNFAGGIERLTITQQSPCLYEVFGQRGYRSQFFLVKYSSDFSRMRTGEAQTRAISIPGLGVGNTFNALQFVLPGVNVCTVRARDDEYDFPKDGCVDHLQRRMIGENTSARLLNAAKELANFCKVQPF